MIDCIEIKSGEGVDQIAARIESKTSGLVAKIRQEAEARIESELAEVVVEVPLSVIKSLLDLAEEGKALREARAKRKSAPAKAPVSEALRQRAYRLADEGKSVAEIAAEIGRTQRQIVGILSQRNRRIA